MRELREFCEQLLLRHASRKLTEYVTYGETRPSHARFSEADARIDRNALEFAHAMSLARGSEHEVQPSFSAELANRPRRRVRSAPKLCLS